MTTPEKRKFHTGRFVFCIIVLLAAAWFALDYKGMVPKRLATGLWGARQTKNGQTPPDGEPGKPIALTPENFPLPDERHSQGEAGRRDETPPSPHPGSGGPIFNAEELKNSAAQGAKPGENAQPGPAVPPSGSESKSATEDRIPKPGETDILPGLPEESPDGSETALTIPKEESLLPASDDGRTSNGATAEGKPRDGDTKGTPPEALPETSPGTSPDGKKPQAANRENASGPSTPGNENRVETELRFGQGKPVSPADNTIRGKTPQVPANVNVSPQNSDSMVLPLFFDSFAKALADGFWPKGTHPQAARGDFSSADVRWLNAYYGLRLTGFAISDSTPQNRERILRYVLTPSMLKALYRSCGPEFFKSLSAHADRQLRQRPGQGVKTALSAAEKSRMFAYYSRSAASLASIINGCLSNAEIGDKTTACLNAEEEAHTARARYLGLGDGDGVAKTGGKIGANAYQAAIVKRERARTALAAAIRRKSDTRQLDQDSLVFIACWLNRRPASMRPALFTLSGILGDISVQFERMRRETDAAGQ